MLLKVIGQISGAEEANEIELITRNFVVANRIKQLARSLNE